MQTSLSQSTSRFALVVDDESGIRRLVNRMLSRVGYTCVEAGSVDEALERLSGREFDLITCDIRMPGKTGLELLPSTSTHCPLTPVIMLTGTGEVDIAISALTKGAWGFLHKPIETDLLLAEINRVQERRMLLLERTQYTQKLETKVREQTAAIRTAHEETIERLAMASTLRDEETGTHALRTGLFCEVMARGLGWADDEVDLIRLSAPMHDVGKIGIPDAVLQKPGRLTAEEFDIIKTHTVIGARMLRGSRSPMLKLASGIALSHHERWDGNGYPFGWAGDKIPVSARMLSIVDVYDALSHDRVYRRALPEGEVFQMLEDGKGTQFDPGLLELFFMLLPEIGRVAQENPDECDETLSGLDITGDPEAETSGTAGAVSFECSEIGSSPRFASIGM